MTNYLLADYIEVEISLFDKIINKCCNYGGAVAMELKYPCNESADLCFTNFSAHPQENLLFVTHINKNGDITKLQMLNTDWDESADMSDFYEDMNYCAGFCEKLYVHRDFGLQIILKELLK